ncbi:hypothetical protein ACJJTC_008658 [Scirpophaga incertulas]
MGQERLSGLAILSIERDIARLLSYKNVIKDFAIRKARKPIAVRGQWKRAKNVITKPVRDVDSDCLASRNINQSELTLDAKATLTSTSSRRSHLLFCVTCTFILYLVCPFCVY